MKIDLNSDIGESYGHFIVGLDEEIMKYISSANIACGFHAGDPITMQKNVQLAKKNGVAIGAHPGFYDLRGFGRREIKYTTKEIYVDLIYQIGALKAFAEIEGLQLQHVKPHGALYNMANKNRAIAKAVVDAVYDIDPHLWIFGLGNSVLQEEAEKKGLPIAIEFFADRNYLDDGSLVPRTEKNAVISDVNIVIKRVIQLVKEGTVTTVTGKDIPIRADTVCIHGDGKTAIELVKALNKKITENRIELKSIGKKYP